MFRCIILVLSLHRASASQYFACPAANFSILEPDIDGLIVVNHQDTSIDFRYERNTLRIYEYPNSSMVNLYLGGTFYSYRAFNSKGLPSRYTSSQKEFEVIGHAELVGDGYDTMIMTGCQFFLADQVTGKLLQDYVDETLQKCLNKRLCNSLGPVTDDDSLRASHNPLAFGPVSVDRTINAQYYHTVDLIRQRLTQTFQRENNATVKVPENPYKYLYAFRGSYQFYGDSLWIGNVIIRKDLGNNATYLSFTIVLGDGFLIYEDVVIGLRQVVQFSLCSGVRGISLYTALTFKFTDECKFQTANIFPKDYGTGKPYSCKDNETYRHDRWLQSLVENTMNGKIVDSIATKVAEEITTYINSDFNCNILGPSKYHFR